MGEPDTGHRWETGAHLAWVTRDIVMLLGGAVCYLNWRLTASPTLGWYAALLTAISIHLVWFDLLRLTSDGDTSEHNPDVLPLVAAPVLVLLAMQRTPIPRRVNPLVLGLAIAVVTGAVRVGQLDRADADPMVQTEHPWLFLVGMVVVGAITCLMVANARSIPARDRMAIALASAVLVASHASAFVSDDALSHAGSAAVGVVGAIGVTVSMVRLCTVAAVTIGASSRLLGDQALQADRRVRRDAEVLHELRATVAGVHKASLLLRRDDSLLPQSHRVKLEAMLELELARMERLLEHRPESKGQVVDLDDVIDPLVTAQRALGFDVRWKPSGVQVVGCPDDLAEAIHILLANAGRHAGHGPTEVSVGRDPSGNVEIRVSDEGPGISEDVSGLLFERGVHAKASPGQGIGLHVARRLIRDHGGDVRLERSERGRGSTFLMVIPELGEETAS